MEQNNFGYSLKNIPIPGKNTFRKCLLEKTECFIHKLRWKAKFSECENNEENASKYYGFKTLNTPPSVELLLPFEEDLYALIKCSSSLAAM